jgi:hypothetical protein
VEKVSEVAVSLGGGGDVSGGGKRLHQSTARAVPQRITRDEPAQVMHRGCVLSARHGFGRERLQGSEVGLFARLALLQHPLLRAILQQRAAIERHRPLERRGIAVGHGFIEDEKVRLHADEVEPQRLHTRRSQAVGLGAERAPQVREVAAQVEGGLALGAVRPEGACQPGALDGASTLQREQREEPLALLRAQARERAAIHLHIKRTEQRHGQRGCRPLRDLHCVLLPWGPLEIHFTHGNSFPLISAIPPAIATG